MKKFSSSSANRLLIKFAVKSIVLSIVSIVLFSLLFSEITYKLDLSLEANNLFSVFIVFLCSVCISYFSVLSLKNSGAIMGMLSCLPIVLFTVINMIINQNNPVLFVIKFAIILLTGALFGILATRKSAKFKVK